MSENRIKLRFGALETRRVQIRDLELYQRFSAVRNSRDEVAHGGDIVGDIQAIKFAEIYNAQYSAAYKQDFHKAYGISYNKAASNIYLYPHQVIRAFDIRCSMMETGKWEWEDNNHLRDQIDSLSQQIINAALEMSNVDELKQKFGRGGSLLSVFEQMNIQYAKGGGLVVI